MNIIKSIIDFFKRLFGLSKPEPEVTVERKDLRIIGIGGFGIRTINFLKEKSIDDEKLFLIDTDSVDLHQSNKYNLPYLQIGKEVTRGFGSGTDSKVGEQSAVEDIDKILNSINDVKKIILILSSGGATGSGIAPIIAKLAKENEVIVNAIVVTSFILNNRRKKSDDSFIDELQKFADELVVIHENQLIDMNKIDKSFSFNDVINVTHEKVFETVNYLT